MYDWRRHGWGRDVAQAKSGVFLFSVWPKGRSKLYSICPRKLGTGRELQHGKWFFFILFLDSVTHTLGTLCVIDSIDHPGMDSIDRYT